MSGAEAIAVLGVISSIITLVDGIKQIYDAATSAEGLPEAFREVAGRLPIVTDILAATKEYIKERDVSEDSCKGVKHIAEACQEKAGKLDRLFRKVIPGDSASRSERYISAVRSLGKGSEVEKLMKGILEDVQLLACEHDMRIATTIQREQIAKAIAEVSAIALSVPESESSFTANYSGSGTQYNAQGEYIAQGNARMYNSNGAPMYFDQRRFYADCVSGLKLSTSDDAMFDSGLHYRSHAIKKWLCPPGHEAAYVRSDHQQICRQRLPGTGQWILNRSEFVKWEKSASSCTLWIHGGPGFGKTYIASSVIEHLQQRDQTNRPFVEVYFYCKFSDAQKNTTVSVLQSLLLQSLLLRPDDENLLSLDSVRTNMVADNAVEDSVPALAQAFSSVIASFNNVFCVVDGLDELLDPERFIKTILSLQYPSKSVFKLLLLSRTQDDIMNAFKVFNHVETLPIKPSDNREDIMLYLKKRSLSMEKFYDQHPERYKALQNSIERGVDGVFMWAKLILDDIEQSVYEDDIVSILERGPASLGLLYDRIIRRLNLEDPTTRRTLTLLCGSLRPLSSHELKQALEVSFEDGKVGLRPMLSRPLEDMLGQKCGNLVEWSPAAVAFKHISSKQYLQSCNATSKILGFDPANVHLVLVCLHFLHIISEKSILPQLTCNRLSGPISHTSTSQRADSGEDGGFVKYATSYWFEHIRKLSTEAQIEVTGEVVAFLSSRACLNWLELLLFFEKDNVFASSSYALMEALQSLQAANEKVENTHHTSILTRWIDNFVPFILDWGPVLIQQPWRLREIPKEALSMFIDSTLTNSNENRSIIRYLGAPPRQKPRNLDTTHKLLLHRDRNVAFTFTASHVGCISGSSVIESSRLAYKSIVPGFQGIRSLEQFMSRDSSTVFTIVSGRSTADPEETFFVFAIMVASEKVPERVFAAAKLIGRYKSHELHAKWVFQQDWYLHRYLLYRAVSGFELPDPVREEWKTRCIVALSFSNDCEILAIYCRDKQISVFARGSLLFSIIPDAHARIDCVGIAATSPSGRFIALVIKGAVQILDTSDQSITTLCSGGGTYAQEYWSSFSDDGLSLVLFVGPRTELNACKYTWEAKQLYSGYSTRYLTIWQAETLWKPGSYSAHNLGDVLDLGFWTLKLSTGPSGRDPRWPYYTEPAIWSKDGTSLRVITTVGPTEWQLSDIIRLATRASGTVSDEPVERSRKESRVLTSPFCNWLFIPGEVDKLIDLNSQAFDTTISVPPSSKYTIDSFRISRSYLFRAIGRRVTHVDLESHTLWELRLPEEISTVSLTRDDIVVGVGSESYLSLNSIPNSFLHFAEVVAYNPCRTLLKIWIPSYESNGIVAILHPSLMLLAFSVQHLGVYLCDLEKSAVPKRLMEPLMNRRGNLYDPDLLLFSECGDFLVWNDPSRLSSSNRLMLYEIATGETTTISVDRNWWCDCRSFKSVGRFMYSSISLDTGRLMLYRWDLRTPTKFERSEVGLLPVSHLGFKSYARCTVLVTDDVPWGILLNSFPSPNAALFIPRKSWMQWQPTDGVLQSDQEDELPWDDELQSDQEDELPWDDPNSIELWQRRMSNLENVSNENGDIDLDIEEIELDVDDYLAEHHSTRSSLMGKGQWVHFKASELLKKRSMLHNESKSFRWVIDFFKDDTVTRIRAVTEGLVNKDHHFRVESAKRDQ